MSLDFTLYVEVDTGGPAPVKVELFETNLTHNLGKMARKAGMYECLWRPEENGFETAADLIAPLAQGLAALICTPELFEPLADPDGWGTVPQLRDRVEATLNACKAHPKAKIEAWR